VFQVYQIFYQMSNGAQMVLKGCSVCCYGYWKNCPCCIVTWEEAYQDDVEDVYEKVKAIALTEGWNYIDQWRDGLLEVTCQHEAQDSIVEAVCELFAERLPF
jgi:hypothetical protein